MEIKKPPAPESWEEAIAYIAAVADATGWDIITRMHPTEDRVVGLGVCESEYADKFLMNDEQANGAPAATGTPQLGR